MTTAAQQRYVPAAGHDFLLPVYDALTWVMGIERTHEALLAQAELVPGARVLDVGCGTGSLLVALKRAHPEVDALGVDPDPKALARARYKAKQASVSISFDHGFGTELPYPEQHFDRVLSSFMFHHVPVAERLALLTEILRVLKPGGRFELLDFAGPGAGRWLVSRWLHSHPKLAHNGEGSVLSLLRQAGFTQVGLTRRTELRLASVRSYQAQRSAEGTNG